MAWRRNIENSLFLYGFSSLIGVFLFLLTTASVFCGARSNSLLVANLRKAKLFLSDRVYEAMSFIDRGDFLDLSIAYEDSPQPIGYNATISAPHMHAMCLEALEPYLQEGSYALDVGSGTGYLTAAMAWMCGESGKVVGVEHIPELVKRSLLSIEKNHSDMLSSGRLIFVEGDGRLGFEEGGPYDAIHVGAASPSIPDALLDQLKSPGRMIIPVGTHNQVLLQITKDENGDITEDKVTYVRYVPLTDKQKQWSR